MKNVNLKNTGNTTSIHPQYQSRRISSA